MQYESPIEAMMAAAIKTRPDERGFYLHLIETPRMAFLEAARAATAEIKISKFRDVAIVYPQVWVGNYIADFVAFYVNYDDVLQAVAIECDGHDFHEKTKKQVVHDKRRDRFFASLGVLMMRFPGTEIYYEANRCAHELCDMLSMVSRGSLTDRWAVLEQKRMAKIEAHDPYAHLRELYDYEEKAEFERHVVERLTALQAAEDDEAYAEPFDDGAPLDLSMLDRYGNPLDKPGWKPEIEDTAPSARAIGRVLSRTFKRKWRIEPKK